MSRVRLRGAGRAIACACFASLAACGSSDATSPRPDVLLLTLDTTRADRLGCYGRGEAATPNLDRAAARGVLFENAYAVTPITLTSHVSILTGTYPCAHEVRHNGMFQLTPEAVSLAEVLRDQGYATGAFVTSHIVDASHGLGQGFEEFPHPMQLGKRSGLPVTEIRARVAVARALEWLAQLPADKPAFLWLHLYDPHRPWTAPEPFASRCADAYDAEIAYSDFQYGRLVEGFERLRPSASLLQILTADHGESNGEHGEDSHGTFLYEATVRVPLIIVPPDSASPADVPRQVAGPVTNAAIPATVLELLDLPRSCMPDVRLASLVAGDYGRLDRPGEPVYLETYVPFYSYRWAPLEAVVFERHKYIRTRRPEIYDLARDPDESSNLHGEAALRRALAAQLEELAALHTPLGWTVQRDVDANEQRQLEALGYAAATHGEPDFDLPDAKDLVATLVDADIARESMQQAARLLQSGRGAEARELFAAAEVRLERIEVHQAGNPSIAGLWGRLFFLQGEFDKAVAPLERALTELERAVPLHLFLGRCYRSQGRAEWAEEEFRKVVYLNPFSVQGYKDLMELLASQDRFGEAVHLGEELERAMIEEGIDLDYVLVPLVALRASMKTRGQVPTPPDRREPATLLPAGVVGRGGG